MKADELITAAAQLLGTDEATLERMASDLAKFPGLREYFDKNFADKDLDELVSEFEQQLKDGFDHGKSPNVRRGRNQG